MKKKKRRRLTNEYPEHLRLPIFLSNEEMANPEEALKAFFDRYNLVAFRACLDEVRDLALFTYNEGGDYSNVIFTLEDAKRLAEIGYLLLEKMSEPRSS